MDEKIAKLFLPILDKLYNTEPAGEVFREPVDIVKYGCLDYYQCIKHPIDLGTIRDKVRAHEYKGDAWRLVADVQLLFANAFQFNKKGSPVYDFAIKLSKIFYTEAHPVMQRLDYCCGTLHQFGPQLLFCHGTTAERYCQITIGAKYKCYQDQYSFCIPCFNKIQGEYVHLQSLLCENIRENLSAQPPVKKTDFIDCSNDVWHYESFIQCTQCSRRVHQICELYPADDAEIEGCAQHPQIELEQRALRQPPPEYRSQEINVVDVSSEEEKSTSEKSTAPETITISSSEQTEAGVSQTERQDSNPSIDDELLQIANGIDEDSHLFNWAPPSPTNHEAGPSTEAAKEANTKKAADSASADGAVCINNNKTNNNSTTSEKKSVDSIAYRLSISKQQTQQLTESEQTEKNKEKGNRDKFVCNHCYDRSKIGCDLRHRKYSARRLPHTRMSRYIETKVNEHIRTNSPSAGEVTIRVLTAYRDIVEVKQEMREYIKSKRDIDPNQHPFLRDYPDSFGYTNRAIFAWQEIDGVDVCVFGMHVQEYGDDCPEPNRQVVYLSYIDSVHFFRPKYVRTAVYHEILLSYFKYVKKLGFRRVFIWVCPSRKGDDYIFYRHPSEQKMPNQKRLNHWYTNLLDKGIMEGIVERHQNIQQFASSQNGNNISMLDLPYLGGDYWPGEFERLLKIMIESQKELETKQVEPIEAPGSSLIIPKIEPETERHNMLSLSNLYQRAPLRATTGKNLPAMRSRGTGTRNLGGDFNTSFNDSQSGSATANSSMSRSEDQPLDLSKSSTNASPESLLDEELSDSSFATSTSNKKKRRKSSSTIGYTKKRSRNVSGASNRLSLVDSKLPSQGAKAGRAKQGAQTSQSAIDSLDPEADMLFNLDRSLRRQMQGFIVARLNDCDCSPHFESQRRQEEVEFPCELMKGREPFLSLARLRNYEFSTLRRAKFSSLAMVKHLGRRFQLEPICNECFSFDSSKRHFTCPRCHDYYLCTSCHENTQHEHIMSLMAPPIIPDIVEFLQPCSPPSATNSISSASSTISNKSSIETNNDLSQPPSTLSSTSNRRDSAPSPTATPLNRHIINTMHQSPVNNMPLSLRQRNRGLVTSFLTNPRVEDVENADIRSFGSSENRLDGLVANLRSSPPPSHSANNIREVPSDDLDRALMENFIRHAEISYDFDFDQMKNESTKLLAHYHTCPMKESCHRCKFVVLSCSFMSVLMRSNRMQAMIGSNCGPITSEPSHVGSTGSGNNSTHHLSGINLTTTPRKHGFQQKEK